MNPGALVAVAEVIGANNINAGRLGLVLVSGAGLDINTGFG